MGRSDRRGERILFYMRDDQIKPKVLTRWHQLLSTQHLPRGRQGKLEAFRAVRGVKYTSRTFGGEKCTDCWGIEPPTTRVSSPTPRPQGYAVSVDSPPTATYILNQPKSTRAHAGKRERERDVPDHAEDQRSVGSNLKRGKGAFSPPSALYSILPYMRVRFGPLVSEVPTPCENTRPEGCWWGDILV